jgi:hypothetical protein
MNLPQAASPGKIAEQSGLTGQRRRDAATASSDLDDEQAIQAAEGDRAVGVEPGESVPWEQVRAEAGL